MVKKKKHFLAYFYIPFHSMDSILIVLKLTIAAKRMWKAIKIGSENDSISYYFAWGHLGLLKNVSFIITPKGSFRQVNPSVTQLFVILNRVMRQSIILWFSESFVKGLTWFFMSYPLQWKILYHIEIWSGYRSYVNQFKSALIFCQIIFKEVSRHL